jgi:hypothetical protein
MNPSQSPSKNLNTLMGYVGIACITDFINASFAPLDEHFSENFFFNWPKFHIFHTSFGYQ